MKTELMFVDGVQEKTAGRKLPSETKIEIPLGNVLAASRNGRGRLGHEVE